MAMFNSYVELPEGNLDPAKENLRYSKSTHDS